jgi:hypothetical protein
MSLSYRFTTLDDAYVLLLEARGLPGIASSAPRVQRCVRNCILVSWVALEEATNHAVDLWKQQGRTFGPLPLALKPRLSTVLAAVSRPPIDDVAFATLRKVRNELTHPRVAVGEPDLAIDQAEKSFEFCISAVRAVFPFRVDCEF